CWLKGLHPEDEPITLSSPLRFSTDRVYLLPSNTLKMSVCEREDEVLSLDPFVVPPSSGSPSEVAFFQGCKHKKLLFLDTGLNAKDRWEDASRRALLGELLNATEVTPTASDTYLPSWASGLKTLEPIDFRQFQGRKSNPVA